MTTKSPRESFPLTDSSPNSRSPQTQRPPTIKSGGVTKSYFPGRPADWSKDKILLGQPTCSAAAHAASDKLPRTFTPNCSRGAAEIWTLGEDYASFLRSRYWWMIQLFGFGGWKTYFQEFCLIQFVVQWHKFSLLRLKIIKKINFCKVLVYYLHTEGF